jgi:hypothetical protein
MAKSQVRNLAVEFRGVLIALLMSMRAPFSSYGTICETSLSFRWPVLLSRLKHQREELVWLVRDQRPARISQKIHPLAFLQLNRSAVRLVARFCRQHLPLLYK